MLEKIPSEQPEDKAPEPPARRSGLSHIANLSSEREAAAHDFFANLLNGQSVESFEREKSANERAVIEGILLSMPEFVRSFGGNPVVNIHSDNVHLIDEGGIGAEERRELLMEDDIAGLYDFRRQRVLVLPSKDSLLTTAQRTVHELLHMEAFLSFTAENGEGTDRAPMATLHLRRIGLGVFSNDQTKRYFRDLDEAVIEELAIRFDDLYFSAIPALDGEIARRADFRNRLPSDARDGIASVKTEQLPDGRWKTEAEGWRYPSERTQLRNLVSQIARTNPGRFSSEESVFSLFAKAALSGRLLEIAHLIEATLGKGAFRKLGEDTMLAG